MKSIDVHGHVTQVVHCRIERNDVILLLNDEGAEPEDVSDYEAYAHHTHCKEDKDAAHCPATHAQGSKHAYHAHTLEDENEQA